MALGSTLVHCLSVSTKVKSSTTTTEAVSHPVTPSHRVVNLGSFIVFITRAARFHWQSRIISFGLSSVTSLRIKFVVPTPSKTTRGEVHPRWISGVCKDTWSNRRLFTHLVKDTNLWAIQLNYLWLSTYCLTHSLPLT